MKFINISFKIIVLLFASLLCYLNPTFSATHTPKIQAPIFQHLGTYHRPISTTNPLAQKLFDQGLILFYGFEWSESARSFRAATALDPHCAMCYWGEALALTYKINAPVNAQDETEAKAAIKKAVALKKYATPLEQKYIEALNTRFQLEAKTTESKDQKIILSCHQKKETNKLSEIRYTTALQEIMQKYPQDNDAKTLYVVSLYWTIDGNPNSLLNQERIHVATQVLKEVLLQQPNHPGANHYLIHVIEPSPHPEQALDSAHRLKNLVPDSQHLVHMPSHIYFLTGRYHDAIDANLQAIATYKNYNKTCRAQGFEPEINYLYFHNYDFLRAAAIMEGRQKLALDTVNQILRAPFPTWLKNESGLQWFIAIPYFVKARFGLWNDLLKEPKPNTQYQYALGMWYYAQGIALAHTGKIDAALTNQAELQKLIQKAPADNVLGEKGQTLLKIAEAMLTATLADIKKDPKLVFAELKKAIRMQDALRYHEPPDWYFPIKEALGDAYLKWGNAKAAKKMFEQDLKQYPNNGWALYGLEKSLRALGKNRKADAVQFQFKQAWQHADIDKPVSFF